MPRTILGLTAASAMVILAGLAHLEAQANGLKIVVVLGEDAVNIIQQKTAVAPIVEVRDANNQPVAGAVVRFAIQGGRATFGGGTPTLTVTTDAAGRAATSVLNPLNNGRLQIQVRAAFQGRTAAATISQTNVATAAQAAAVTAGAGAAGTGAAVAAAAAGGSAAAAGGGLSAVAIGAIAGGAGGGALIAAKAAGVVGGPGPCVFTVSPTSFTVPGLGSINLGPDPSVSVGLADDNCEPTDWTAASSAAFVTFRDASSNVISTLNGRGNASLSFNVAANTPGNVGRTGTFTVAGQTVAVNQNGRCLYAITPASLTFAHGGGTLVVSVNITPSVCDTDTWTVSTISNFLSFTPSSGKGSGVVSVTASPNPFSLPLTGNIGVAGTIINVVVP